MASYGKKMLGLASMVRTPMNDVTNINRVSPPGPPTSKDKYSIEHMKNFLDSVKTPAEMRMLERNKGTERGNAEVEASCHAADDENDKSDDLEVGEDALTSMLRE